MRLTAPRGFTLIELVVAVAILSLGTVAAYRSFDTAQRGLGGQVPRALASEVALNRAADLRILGAAGGRALPTAVSMGGVDWTVAVVFEPAAGGLSRAEILVASPGRPGARLVAFVPEAAP